MSASVDMVNFGCRLNIVEAEAMRREATAAGHDNLVIVNTCAVTSEAVRQARQAIRRIAREKPEARIIVTGCAVQTEPERFAAMPEIARIIGNGAKTAPGTWQNLFATQRVTVNDIMGARETAGHFLDGLEGFTRGFLQVQNGCDHRCTFCIIPFGRGPSRSSGMGEVVEQARKLVGHGVREIVLTGVDLTSYGSDLPGTPKLGRLVQQVLKHVPDLARLRLSSLDCIEADDELREAIASQPRLMPHLHLSLQSGDDMVLKRMKRRHNRAQAVQFCADMRKARPDIVFGADLIAGFPTETEAMFAQSLALIEDCGLTHLHVFPYSARTGTPAARMPPVSGDVVKARARRLREAGAAALQTHLAAQADKILRVLMERGGMGRAEDFTQVRVPGVEAGEILDVRVTGVEDGQLCGTLHARADHINHATSR